MKPYSVVLPRIKLNKTNLTTILEVNEDNDEQDTTRATKRNGFEFSRRNSFGSKQNNSTKLSFYPDQRKPLVRARSMPVYQGRHWSIHGFCNETLEEKKRKFNEIRSTVLDSPLNKKTNLRDNSSNGLPKETTASEKENQPPKLEKWMQFFG